MKITKKSTGRIEPMVKHDYCPTQGGVFTAYVPEYFDGKEWKRIPTQNAPVGVPLPLMNRGVMDAINLFGYEQAQAIAWSYAAFSVSSYDMRKTEVRVQAYEVFYDIKARKIDVSPAKSA